jgi:hypothetical protein
MAGSALDSRFYPLECPRCRVIETIILRELQRLRSWRCSTCSHVQDLLLEPYKTALAREFSAAEKLDREKRGQG